MSHERPVHPFSDLHVEGDHVRATLLHDPTVEGLEMALYIDGSGSMKEEYEPREVIKGGFWKRLFGGGEKIILPNIVTPEARRMLAYLATKDRNGVLRTAYWACGAEGKDLDVIGEISGVDAETTTFEGPKHPGGATYLAPAVRDFAAYIKECARSGARQGCAVFITDGAIHDLEEVHAASAEIARAIGRGTMPRVNFVLVGVGDAIDEEQMERIAHEEFPGIGHLWCHRVAAEMKELPELVAVLVDETMTVAAGGTVTDNRGNILKIYEGRLPAVLEFEIGDDAESFILEVNGVRFEQPLPEERDHHDEHEEEHH